ncbi:MAG TPA: HD domain-containing protein [Flavobacterium sp.]|jgi:HD superfamily phosphodiesterase
MLNTPESDFILEKLTAGLPLHLHYHSISHTLDVYNTAAMIAAQENITADDTRLLLTAALFHDSGFLHQSKGHEAVSCRIASEVLPQFGYTKTDIERVCLMISATKIPQNPHSLLESIICDADLDYLGRDDFFETGHNLYLEMLAEGTIASEAEFDHLQIDFLQQHVYFTNTSRQLRNDKKAQHLKSLLSKTI